MMDSYTFIMGTPFSSIDAFYTLVFLFGIFCAIHPPGEFVSAGLTLENVFSRFLGSETTLFFEYHIRRTTMIRVVSSYSIVIYYCTMRLLSDNIRLASPNWHAPFTLWDIILWCGMGVATYFTAHTYVVWYANGTWCGHPTVMGLRRITDVVGPVTTVDRWKPLVSSINAECRRMDKFVASPGGLASSWPGHRVVVTDSWLLSSHLISFKAIRQSHDHLVAVVSSTATVPDTASVTEGGRPAGESLGSQLVITVRIADVNSGACVFSLSIPASNLDALHAKLQCPLIHAEGVELEPTIVQRFIEIFTQVVDENEPVKLPTDVEIEQCIGCMTCPANVVLAQRCDPSAKRVSEGNSVSIACGACRCNPMWCLDCMARWFAARQTEAHRDPSVWLSGQVTCPTCRVPVCVRDVVRVVKAPS